MTVAIHQPNFFPWMGYFYKIAMCDSFVFFDTAQFTQPSFIRRVKIHKAHDANEEMYITVQLQKYSNFDPINKLNVGSNLDWQNKIKAQIHHVYHKAPYYHQLRPILDVFFTDSLVNLNFSSYSIELIKFVSELLGLVPKYFVASEMDIQSKAGDANIEMVKKVGGSSYISGYGAKKYQSEMDFEKEGISFRYTDYLDVFNRTQIPIHFRNKSIVSYLAYYSVEEIREMFFGKVNNI